MLTNARIISTLPVVDMDRARRFYEERLGLRPLESTAEGGVVFTAGGGTLLELTPQKEPTKAEHTALTFEVDNVERELTELESRGVRFEDYDMPGLKTENHIARMDGEKGAWFKDPEGNILCIHQKAS
jgi:catechol 2,3-dioxygenase-like lactoylglutathione lyase family enzyme